MKLEIDALGIQHAQTHTVERDGDRKSIIDRFIADGGFFVDNNFVPWGAVQDVRFEKF